MSDFAGMTVVLVGPLPPPSGGMANQTKQLARLLELDGAHVRVVRTNVPYRPRWMGRLRGVRALARLVPYVGALRRAATGADLFHVMANSGWAWHLFAAPALAVARSSGVPAVVNYRGGRADEFFARSFWIVKWTLGWAKEVVVPSPYLREVFAGHGVTARIVPNVIDLERFRPVPPRASNGTGPRVLIARNLEPIYDIETGIRAFARMYDTLGGGTLDVAGSGPESERLAALADELGIADAVRFRGTVDNDSMPELYREADIALNPSLVDNMPVSILEALACGVPIVSTDVGGVPAVVDAEREAVLVPPRDPERMASALIALWRSEGERSRLREAGLEKARTFGWDAVREEWARVYRDVVDQGGPA